MKKIKPINKIFTLLSFFNKDKFISKLTYRSPNEILNFTGFFIQYEHTYMHKGEVKQFKNGVLVDTTYFDKLEFIGDSYVLYKNYGGCESLHMYRIKASINAKEHKVIFSKY